MARLADTAREDIADCAAASYRRLSLAAARKLLMLDSTEALLRFLRERRPAIAIVGDALVFQSGEAPPPAGVDYMGLLGTTLEYAVDLERIV